ncbi:MAG: FAD-dependent oxidoreductase, partial [Planctomycetota bacterium]|nr:FAD-dependent oxidoreductase [Planctomycetota bacterium]
AQVRTPRLLEALRECCVALSVRIEEGCEVRALLKDGERVLGVQTQQCEATADVTAGATVLCAGAWSSQLDPLLAEQMPVHPVRGQILLLKMPDPPIRHIISLEEEHFYMVARDDGHVLVGSTEEHDSAFNNRNTAQAVARLSALAIKYVPILSGASVVRTWAGLRPGTPDRRPFLGFVPGLSNFIAATGNFRTGLATAPIVADIVADLLQKGMCQYNLAKAAPGREYPN